jgi:hypothetical protein
MTNLALNSRPQMLSNVEKDELMDENDYYYKEGYDYNEALQVLKRNFQHSAKSYGNKDSLASGGFKVNMNKVDSTINIIFEQIALNNYRVSYQIMSEYNIHEVVYSDIAGFCIFSEDKITFYGGNTTSAICELINAIIKDSSNYNNVEIEQLYKHTEGEYLAFYFHIL